MDEITLIHGDCLEEMAKLKPNSIDTIITDPPYGLSFMGKKWDYDVPSIKLWQEVLRVAKPGATLLTFGGTRTYHRMACAIEDAGWVLKDCIMWLYGSGFPKATDISKQIDKRPMILEAHSKLSEILELKRKEKKLSKKQVDELLGTNTAYSWWVGRNHYGIFKVQMPSNKNWKKLKNLFNLSDELDKLFEEAIREIIGKQKNKSGIGNAVKGHYTVGGTKAIEIDITAPATPQAKLWNGWKSHGLKPAYEPIIVAMKPNEGSYAANALKHGVAGLNIDGGRIETNEIITNHSRGTESAISKGKYGDSSAQETHQTEGQKQGRFPANIILDEEAAKMLDEQSGVSKSIAGIRRNKNTDSLLEKGFEGQPKDIYSGHQDKGGASRFFYVAKASKAERNVGCGELEEKEGRERNIFSERTEEKFVKTGQKNLMGEEIKKRETERGGAGKQSNHHPTVKPLKLMEYLCRLTKTPTGGVVLDPFMGSGTTGMACKITKRKFIGIEKEKEYFKIAQKRIIATQKTLF